MIINLDLYSTEQPTLKPQQNLIMCIKKVSGNITEKFLAHHIES